MLDQITLLLPPETILYLKISFKYLYKTMPIWLPVAFLYSALNAWVRYKRQKFWQKEGSVLLEIRLPKEITKSPAAMEMALGAFSQPGGESTWIDRILNGKTRSWFSLEIASVGGNIKFFVWTRPKHRSVIEAAFYSQYPGIEIYEVPDYTKEFYYHPEKNNVWGCELALTQPDPWPIKTYIDYGLDRDPKEEFKIDPMSPLIELLGSIGPDHNVWIQIIIRAHKKRRALDMFGEKEDSWKDEMAKEKNKIIEQFKPKDKTEYGRFPTKGETDRISALERAASKTPFDVGIRAIYIADKDKFNSGIGGGISGSFKQYGSADLNGFKPTGWFGIFDWPWEEKWGNPTEKMKHWILDEYKARRYFYSPLKNKKTVWGKKIYSKPFVLNAEELATIYHFPGSVVSTPTFGRIPSKKSEAPSNLPI